MRDLPKPTDEAAAKPSEKSGAQAPTTTTAEERSASFQPVQGGELKSGEVLLVEAYAAIWAMAFVLILLSFRRQRRLDARVDALQAAIDRARSAEEPGKGQG